MKTAATPISTTIADGIRATSQIFASVRGGGWVVVHDQMAVVRPGDHPRAVDRQRCEHEREEVQRRGEDRGDGQRRPVARLQAFQESVHSRPRREHAAKERPGALFLWIAEDLARRPFLEDHPFVEEADLVGDFAREVHLVRGDDHGHADLREVADELQDLAHELRIEGARDLVEQHQLGIHGERPHDRDALLLPAREAIGELLGLVEQADAVEQLVRARLGVVPRLPARLAWRERDVLEHGHVREQVVGLEDDADLLSQLVDVRLLGGQVVPVERDRAGVDRLEQVDAAEQRRLARAGGADQADDVVQAHLEADVLEHLVVDKRLPDVLDVHEAVVHAAARSRASRWRMMLSVKRARGIVRSTKKIAASV